MSRRRTGRTGDSRRTRRTRRTRRRTLGASWLADALSNDLGGSTKCRNRGSTSIYTRKTIPGVREVVVPVRDAEGGTILDDGVRNTPRVEGSGSGEGREVHEGEQKNETSVNGHVVESVDIRVWKGKEEKVC